MKTATPTGKKPLTTIDVDMNEELIDVTVALKSRLPYTPSPVTVWRWRTRGANRVKLPAVRCGSKWLTTTKAIDEWIQRQHPVTAKQDSRPNDMQAKLQAAGLTRTKSAK